MNDEYSKNGTLTGPLIFTVPAYGFVMALYLDCLGQSHRAALSAKTFAAEVETVEPVRPKPPERAKSLILFFNK